MRLVGRIAIILLAVWLQTAFFGAWRPFGAVPDLAVIVVVVSGLLSEATPTLATAIGIGLLLDLSSGTDFGLRTAYCAALGLAVITARQYGFHSDSLATLWSLIAIGTVGLDVLLLLSLGVPSWGGHLEFISGRIGVELALTLVIGTVGYFIAAAFSRRQAVTQAQSLL